MDRPFEKAPDSFIEKALDFHLAMLNYTSEAEQEEVSCREIGELVVEQLIRLNESGDTDLTKWHMGL